ncbi:MAG TPA: bifunctional nicotinamide-nucleotide adenylyltransferase/Nudix hydroxylase [Variovorax sp.]
MTPSTVSSPDAAVLIGRFQPFHDGHLALLQQALARAPRVVVVLGSAFQARSPKNPLTWQERAQMICGALPEAQRPRLHFTPVRDHFDELRWIAEVRQAVAQTLAEAGAPAAGQMLLVGHFRDATREYLRAFPDWALHAAKGLPVRRASAMRRLLFAGGAPALETLRGEMPVGSIDFLRTWSAQAHFAPLAEEAGLLDHYEASWAAAPYPPVLVTVDCVVKCGRHVLLVRRGQAPGKGLYAVPGGFLEQRETTQQAALRELDEETHLALPAATLRACLKATDVFDRPDRSQRGRTITHGHFFDLGERELPPLRADDDAESAAWTPLSELHAMEDRMLDDHFQMLDHYLGLLPR